jgi:ABC-type multidrug transport system fused ATPase/permease subunit
MLYGATPARGKAYNGLIMKRILTNSLALLTRPERRRMGMLVVLDTVISLADIASLAWLLFIVHLYTGQGATGHLAFLPDWLQNNHSLLPIALFLLLFSGKNLAGFLVYRAQCRFISGVATRIAHKRLLHYLEGAYTNYVNVDSSVHIRNISYQPIDFGQHVLGGIQQIITQCILIVLAIAGILLFNVQLFLLLFGLLLPPVVLIFYLVKKKLKRVRQEVRTSSEKALQYLQEALNGFVESNIYHKNEAFLERYMDRQRAFNRHFTEVLITQGIPSRLMEVFALLGLFILVALSQWSGNTGSDTLLTIGAFMAAAYKIIPGIVKVLTLSGQINTYAYTTEELTGQTTATSPIVPQQVPIQSLQFNQVHFKYGTDTILRNLSWTIEPGDFIGLAGHSGTGKTTVLNLLLGFLDPAGGSILVNGQVTGQEERRQYWSSISYVKQQPFLTHDTILHNITLNGRLCNEQKLEGAIQAAGLHHLINSFTEKQDKVLAENGKNISGGQRQRIAIARALYKDADLIILDEPFNELDAKAEQAMLQHFKELTQQGKMVILITHNQQSLSFCNKIISLHEEA